MKTIQIKRNDENYTDKLNRKQPFKKLINYRHYFVSFYKEQPEKVREKMDYILTAICKTQNGFSRFLQQVAGTSGLYKIRIRCKHHHYQVFCCFAKGGLMVLLNVLQQQTQHATKTAIKLALKLKKQYFKRTAIS